MPDSIAAQLPNDMPSRVLDLHNVTLPWPSGPWKIGEEVRRAMTAKSSDMEIGGLGKRFGHGQTHPGRAKIRSDRGKIFIFPLLKHSARVTRAYVFVRQRAPRLVDTSCALS